jgi:hypothetical protein
MHDLARLARIAADSCRLAARAVETPKGPQKGAYIGQAAACLREATKALKIAREANK